MIGRISRNTAYAIEEYIKWLPGVHCAGDRWFCEWLDMTRSQEVKPYEAEVFQLGIYVDKGGSYKDLLKIFARYGVFPTSLNPTFNHEVAKTELGTTHVISAPITESDDQDYYMPATLKSAFNDGIDMLQKFVDFTFPMTQRDMDWLNVLLKKFSSQLRGTAYDTHSELWRFSFADYTASFYKNYVVLAPYSEYMSDPKFVPNHFINNILQLHKIATAIGADTSYHMHHGSRTVHGIQELYLINERQTV